MKTFLEIVEIIAGVLLVISVLFQHRGTGLGGAFGGQDMSYRSRRGLERFLLRATIVLAAVFLVTAIAQLLV